ncbi:MAG: ThiF family adenylyltransferase [Zoogloeaceae bacterium]|jgi:proteasome lid subunit RPN8/RPN11|nr:ThiF family adenylyltransferase [Zoogloeaceae bacterium]
MTERVHRKIHQTIGNLPVEQGGVLGSSDGGKTITHFCFDECAATTGITYAPDVGFLNNVVLPDWHKRGIQLMGVIHSHPRGSTRPSPPDAAYAARVLAAMGKDRLVLPIVQSSADGPYELHGYIAELHCDSARICDANIRIVPDKLPDFYARVDKVTPQDVMRRKTLVCVGCGGNGEFIETMARTGVGKIVVIDGDAYAPTNLATQHCYRDELGENKAIATAQRIRRIDPNIDVLPLPRFLDEALTDTDFEDIVGQELFERPQDVLLVGCTDDFYAQARTARLALKYATPYLAAQLYEAGRAAEVLFTYPGVTPACPRCILRPRYEAYLHNGYVNDVGSHQSPIFAAQRVNALKGFIALMLLLYHESGPFSALLDEVATRNVAQIRMNPDPSSPVQPLFYKHLGASPLTFFDETLWVPVEPDEDCPDCHGAITDTRELGGELTVEH